MFLHIYTKYFFSHLLIKCKQICEINQVNSFMQKTRCPRLRWSTRCSLEHLKSFWRTSIIRFYSWVHADVSKMFQFKSDFYADNIICKEKGCIRWQKNAKQYVSYIWTPLYKLLHQWNPLWELHCSNIILPLLETLQNLILHWDAKLTSSVDLIYRSNLWFVLEICL